MKTLEAEITSMIGHYALLEPNRPVGVALSGGADSVALLAALTRLGYDCTALHCNFHLRGDESQRDAELAELTARRLGARWRMTDFDVAGRQRLTGESVEMACRELRYAWFADMHRELGLQAVAIAHHRDDRIETFMLNSLRGTGLRGLAAMRPRRGIFVRPMLGCSRAQIEAYLAERGIAFATDSSNLTDDYQRNRVRHHLLPALTAVRPDALERFADTLTRLDDSRHLYEYMLADFRRRFTAPPSGAIRLAEMAASVEPEALRPLLYELIAPYGLGIEAAEQILRSAGESGRRFGPLLLNRGELIPVDDSDAEGEVEWTPGAPPLELTQLTPDEFHPEREPLTIYLDGEAFAAPHRWTIRPWRIGDRIRPFGMRGSRLVSDLLSDAKMSVADKQRVRILACDDRLIWVIGLRASAHFPITPSSTVIYQLTYRE